MLPSALAEANHVSFPPLTSTDRRLSVASLSDVAKLYASAVSLYWRRAESGRQYRSQNRRSLRLSHRWTALASHRRLVVAGEACIVGPAADTR
ncbi:unnamed protein product [Sphagnum balticum]